MMEPSGRIRFTLDLPRAVRLQAVAGRRVFGVSVDTLGVQRVVVYPLLVAGLEDGT